MNTPEMIAAIITLLNMVETHGERNLKIMVDVLARLQALLDGVKDERERHEAEIAALEDQLRQRPPVQFHEDGSVTLGGEVLRDPYEGVKS